MTGHCFYHFRPYPPLGGIKFLTVLIFNQFNPTHQAFAAHFADMRMTIEFYVQFFQQVFTLARRLPRKIFIFDDIQCSQTNRTGSWMTTIGIGVHPGFIARLDQLGYLIVHADTPQRHITGSDSLGKLHQVGLYVVMIECKHFPCSSKGGYYLVNDE
jgi:hypothetical protein